jgi:hypothetical protein
MEIIIEIICFGSNSKSYEHRTQVGKDTVQESGKKGGSKWV